MAIDGAIQGNLGFDYGIQVSLPVERFEGGAGLKPDNLEVETCSAWLDQKQVCIRTF